MAFVHAKDLFISTNYRLISTEENNLFIREVCK